MGLWVLAANIHCDHSNVVAAGHIKLLWVLAANIHCDHSNVVAAGHIKLLWILAATIHCDHSNVVAAGPSKLWWSREEVTGSHRSVEGGGAQLLAVQSHG